MTHFTYKILQSEIDEVGEHRKYVEIDNDKMVHELDMRTDTNVSVFPRNLYTNNPFASSVSYVIAPRDKATNYIYGKEQQSHTLWFSRFGYDRFRNEYGVGAQSRGYIEPFECHSCDDVPRGVAPQRFYSDEHLW